MAATPSKRSSVNDIFGLITQERQQVHGPACTGTCTYFWNGTDWELDPNVPTTCSEGCACVAPPHVLAEFAKVLGVTLQSIATDCGKTNTQPTRPIPIETLVTVLLDLLRSVLFWKRLALGLGLLSLILLGGMVYFATR